MREINEVEIREVEGGAAFLIPIAMWAVKTTVVRVTAKGIVAGASAYLGIKAVDSFTN